MEYIDKVNENLKRYIEQLRSVKVVLYVDFAARFKKDHAEDIAKVLAGQVINYLMGEDIEEVYQNAAEPLKSKIGQIKDQVSGLADKLMQSDAQLRQVIVYTLRMEDVYKLGEFGEEYLTSADKARIDRVLKRYEGEFTEEATPSLYSLIVTRFIQEKQHLFQN